MGWKTPEDIMAAGMVNDVKRVALGEGLSMWRTPRDWCRWNVGCVIRTDQACIPVPISGARSEELYIPHRNMTVIGVGARLARETFMLSAPKEALRSAGDRLKVPHDV